MFVMPQCCESFALVPPCHFTYTVERVLQVYLALSPEPGLLSPISLGQAPFLQALRRARSPLLLVRALRRYYGLVRLPAIVHHGCTFFLTMRTSATGQGRLAGSPGFRARSFGTCLGSPTSRSPAVSCGGDAADVAFRPCPGRRRSGQCVFAARYPAHTCPCRRLSLPLAGKQPRLGEQRGSLLLSL